MTDLLRPYLVYTFWSRDHLTYVGGGDIDLATVHEVSVRMHGDGPVVAVRGRMLKRNGDPGPGRGSVADLARPQPAWLVDLVADALRRLGDGERAVPSEVIA